MPRRDPVYQWTVDVATHVPHLSPAHASVLALWSLGMVLARSCALTAVTLVLATWQRRKANTVRQQLREFCYDAAAKHGEKRQAVPVEPCVAPLLRWVLAGDAGAQVARALDATTLGSRFVVLAISVVDRGCGIPVAWSILPAGPTGAGQRGGRVRLGGGAGADGGGGGGRGAGPGAHRELTGRARRRRTAVRTSGCRTGGRQRRCPPVVRDGG